jgi:hypothetical protein
MIECTETCMEVHFVRPESFYGRISLPSNWVNMNEDERVEWLQLYFDYNPSIRSVEVEEYRAHE